VEPACAVLEFPASTYYAAKKREHQPSPREQRDAWLKKQIKRVWDDRKKGRRVYGARKVWLQLRREDIEVARCTVERLMKELGIAGAAARRKKPRTTVPDAGGQRPADLLERDFTAAAPNRRWVADITYVDTACGFSCTSFVTDLFSRKIVGWQVADHLRAGLALDALEMAIFSRKEHIGGALVHHSDRGVQGGFNWSSQHLDLEVWRYGCGETPAGDSCDARPDVVARPAVGCAARGSRAVLGGDRSRRVERGRGGWGWRVAGRRLEMVPAGWRDAADHAVPAVGAIPVVR